MRPKLALIVIVVSLYSPSILDTATAKEITSSETQNENGHEYDNESARKIIGSRVVTSVSVVMNGKEPQFADAVGNYVPRPLVPPRVASPVSLLDPDRYEFYTFNDDGDLVKRLMTMEEIQSIVANGDSEQQVAMAKNPTGNDDHEANIRNIVNNVQKVLHTEMANNNFTASLMYNKLDTPDTSSSWSSILPAIFGNTGESILTNKTPATTDSTADSIIMHTTNKKPLHKNKTPSTSSILKTTSPPKTTVTKITKQKPKPSRPISVSPSTTIQPSSPIQNTKFTTITKTTQTVKNTLKPNKKTSNSQHNTTFTSNPTKAVTAAKPLSTLLPSSIVSITQTPLIVNKLSTQKTKQEPGKITSTAIGSLPTKKPTNRPTVASNKYSTSAIKISPTTLLTSTHTTRLPSTVEIAPTKKNKVTNTQNISSSYNTYIMTTPTKKISSQTTTPKPKTTKITTDELRDIMTSTVKYTTTSAQPLTTRKIVTRPTHSTTYSAPQTVNPDSMAGFEPEPDDVFDSELSLNQIIESLKDLEGTTMPFASNYMDSMDMTTFEPDADSVTITNNGQIKQTYLEKDASGFKQSNNVSYIPQTTIEYSQFTPTTKNYVRIKNQTISHIHKLPIGGIEHKESDDDDMILNDKTTTESDAITTTDDSLSKQSTNSMDTLLRESFDSVISQIQNTNELSSTIDYDLGTTLNPQMEDSTTIRINEKKKTIVKPTPHIPLEEIEGVATEPMKYFETVIKHYEQEKNKSQSIDKSSTESMTQKITEKTMTEEPFGLSSEAMTNTKITTDNNAGPDLATTTENVVAQTIDAFKSNDEESEIQTTTIPTEDTVFTTDFLIVNNATNETETFESMQTTTPSEDGMGKKTTDYYIESTEKFENDFSTMSDEEFTTKMYQTSTVADILDQTTIADLNQDFTENQTQYEMVQLIENIMKNMTDDKGISNSSSQNSSSYVERKEDSTEISTKPSEFEMMNDTTKRAETEFSDLGEATTTTISSITNQNETVRIKTNLTNSIKSTLNKLKLPTLAPILNNLKMKVVNALKNANTINLEPAPKQALGLEESTINAGEDILEFAKFCNEVAFNFWIALNNEGISSARSLTLSPFALTSMLGALFLGARGRTSGEINDMLHLDDIVTFNPHAMLHNISESIDGKKDENVYNNVFVRELLSDRSKGKILPFFKEKVNQFYSGYVEEVNFSTINDIIRRRTNLLMKRYTDGKVSEFLKTSNVWVKPPLAGISANLFETDCSKASKTERDGEMFFQVLPAIRQRRLIPIPAVVWKSGFTAGYDPELDATAVAIGLSKNIISTIFVMPGQQGHSAPGDNLERLESVLMANAVSQNAWRRLLATLMERPGLEVQLPRFTHRSFVNATNALRKLGLDTLFDQNSADLRGITGSISRDMYVSDLIQINTFSTCGEDKLPEEHHIEMYPAPPNKHRTMEYNISSTSKDSKADMASMAMDYENERAFASDPIYDLRYLNLPLPLRPRQARVPEIPRLRFDKPFVYFVRHNPTGMVLYFGRFNPRLLP